jgi:hypothetical protein
MPWLNVTKWVAFIPHGEAGGGCFNGLYPPMAGTIPEKFVNLNPNASYVGRLIMTLDPTRPMPRLINALLEGLKGVEGLEPGFPFDVSTGNDTHFTHHVLRARDVQPYASIETLNETRAGEYHYVIVDRDSADWLALRERFPNVAEQCSVAKQLRNETVFTARSKACCGGSSEAAGLPDDQPNVGCVPFTTEQDCRKYVKDWNLVPSDNICKDADGEHRVPAYAYKKVYKYGLQSEEKEPQLWKDAENPWSILLFESVLNMSRADKKLYAESVCSNSYTGQRVDDKVYLLNCSNHGVCWRTGEYSNLWDPPGQPVHKEDQQESQVYCTYFEKQSVKAWAISEIGSIAGWLRMVIFANALLYSVWNVAPVVADAVKQEDSARRRSKKLQLSSMGLEHGSGPDLAEFRDSTNTKYLSCDPVSKPSADDTIEVADCEVGSSSIRRRGLL